VNYTLRDKLVTELWDCCELQVDVFRSFF